MGPEAKRIAVDIGAPKLNKIAYFKTALVHVSGKEVRAARMSYVGEAGWELTCKTEDAPIVYATLLEAGATPAGLFAQTSMRIEKGFCAMGHELDSDVSPIEAGLAFATRKSGGFIGFEAMQERRENGAIANTVSLTFDKKSAEPLGHEPIILNDEIIGQTSSCAFGYRVGRPIALGHVNSQITNGTQVAENIAGDICKAKLSYAPIWDPKGTLMKA
jgi:4-methylaminobutanoate oxidase (formaldehyde-forming)